MCRIILYQIHGFYLRVKPLDSIGHQAPIRKRLRYQTDTGEFEEVPKSELTEVELDIENCRGLYIKLSGDYYGLYSTPEGPVLFQNQERFFLGEEASQLELKQLRGHRHRFSLLKDGEMQLEVTYPRAPQWILGPDFFWDYDFTEEDADFFLWLTNITNKNMHTFIEHYTLKEEREKS